MTYEIYKKCNLWQTHYDKSIMTFITALMAFYLLPRSSGTLPECIILPTISIFRPTSSHWNVVFL